MRHLAAKQLTERNEKFREPFRQGLAHDGVKTMKTMLRLQFVFLALTGALSALAADIESGTNTIQGVVQFANADPDILARLGPPGNEGMTDITLFAYSVSPDSLSAIKGISGADKLSNPYTLTVTANNVPRSYDVFSVLTLDGQFEEFWTPTTSSVFLTSNSPPATVDFYECVALLEIRYQRPDGTPVAALGGRATMNETASPNYYRGGYSSQPAGRMTNFLVVPAGVEFSLNFEVDTGTDLYTDRITHRETLVATYACDEKPVLIITIPNTGLLGRINGNANVVGEIELATEGYLELLGRPVIKAAGPSGNQRYAALAAESPGPDATRPFALESLVPSTPAEPWNVWAEMQFGAGHRFEFFRSPGLGEGTNNPGATVTAGAATVLGDTFVMNPARLVGKITLTGPPEFAGSVSVLRSLTRATDSDLDMDGVPDGIGPYGIYGSYVVMSGVDELVPGATFATAGASVQASFAGAYNPATSAFEGDYVAVLGMLDDQPGIWKQDGISLRFSDPGTNGGPPVDEGIYIAESTPWRGALDSGGRATNHLSYGMAEVCLRIKSPAPFFYPRITGSTGGLTNATRSYAVSLQIASSPPYSAAGATNEAVITLYVPEGSYTLNPTISVPDPDGGVSEVQLPSFDVSVMAGERYCVEDCIRIFIEPPICSTNTGFIGWGNAISLCGQTLTNISVTIRPLSDPSIRLGYSERWLLIGATNAMRMPGQVFPEFDGYLPAHPEYYENMVFTVVAKDNLGHVATRSIITHYDFTPPVLNCSNITVTSPDGGGVLVDFIVTATDDRPEPLRGPTCVPPSGSLFAVGTTTVTCTASDLCRNTNTCTFTVIVQPPNTNCELHIALTQLSPPFITLTWECTATLQCAPSVTGPWTSLVGTNSPYTAPADAPQKFFRLCLSGDCSGDVVSNCNPPGLLVHEPFDYAAGSALNSLNGGTGFSGPWSNSINGPNYTIANGSLSSAPLCATGGRMHSTVGHTRLSRPLSASFGSDGTTRYFSFLLRPEGVLNGGDLGGFHGVQIGNLFIGKPGGAGGGVLAPYVLEEVGGAGQVLSPVVPVIDETVLLVVKAEFAAGNDTFTLYANPTPGAPEPVAGTVKSDLDLGTPNELFIYSGGEFSLDELRVGETFASVTPR